ncbi:MAG: cobalt-precorrin-5B (C(1))-methyltransferase [Pseudomonadota bacterium]|nr:cobalt-precorrin-5B (C(1))-methyltransferase [Pseudomonadota bacterium]
MDDTPPTELRRGWTTGACATAAVRAALIRLWGGAFPGDVTITLPKGETPTFALAHTAEGPGWAEVGITKDAGDDPDVTHGALIVARVTPGGQGIRFAAGPGVGTVTKPGLPIPPGEPAINPVPREMMRGQVAALAAEYDQPPDVEITISIPGGEALAAKTWNPRLGITGGLSVLGTTGVVRPFSCAAWIASIHRGIDVARAEGLTHVAGCTGATSEAAVQALHGLPDGAMLDMGDFVGGMLKYLAKHPVERVTVGGGIGKIAKLAQGAMDLHSKRSQVDTAALAALVNDPRVETANTALEAYEIAGAPLAQAVAEKALAVIQDRFGDDMTFDVVIVDRKGAVIGQAGP